MVKSAIRLLVLVALVMGLLVPPAAAQDEDSSDNMDLVGNVPSATIGGLTDLAFWGRTAVAGSSSGFRIIDIKDPTNPGVIAQVSCNGAQGDVSVWENLVFRSVDGPRASTDCGAGGASSINNPGAWNGIQIFDISDPQNAVKVASVQVDCGSHTHTLVPDPDNDRVFLYISSYPLGGAKQGQGCLALQADGSGGHGKISIVEVPLDDPAAATVTPYFLDDDTEWGNYLGFVFRACHDISVFTELNLAAAACMTEGQLWDISDPAAPEFLWRYDNPVVQPANIDLFHSAAFSWDGEIVAFGDESGGGGAARCVDPDDDQGRIWFVDTATGAELTSFKIPRSETGTCTMHNFNFIPQRRGVYTLVASSYTGGTTVVDVNALLAGASDAEAERGWAKPAGTNSWSSYWYNDYIYSSGARGLDVFEFTDKVRVKMRQRYSNPQTQERVLR